MNKRKFFTIIAAFALPVVIIAALLSTSSNLFKGSILDDLGLAGDFSFAITNPGFNQIVDTEAPVISEVPLYIDLSDPNPYLFNFVTSEEDGVSYNLSLYSFSEEIDFTTMVDFSDLDADTALKGSLTNVNIIKDSTGNVIEVTTDLKEVTNANSVNSFVWNKQCRYDQDLNLPEELSYDSELVEFRDCNSDFYHYLSMNVRHDTDSRTLVFPVQFTDTQSINWTLPGDTSPNFLEGANAAVNKNYTLINFEDDSTPEFTFEISEPYTYNVKLVSSEDFPYGVLTELTHINTEDFAIRELESSAETKSEPTTFTYDKTCNNSSEAEVACSDASALLSQAIQITIDTESASKSYFFPISNGYSDSLANQRDIRLVSPIKTLSPAFRPVTGDESFAVYNHSVPLLVGDLLQGESLPFHIISSQNLEYDYKLEKIQAASSTLISSAITRGEDIENKEEITSSESSVNGYTIFDWDGSCIDEDEDGTYCNNNYLLLTVTNPNSDPVKTTYYIFTVRYTDDDHNINWLRNKPFNKSSFDEIDTNRFVSTEALQINLENTDPIDFYFNSNRDSVNYRGKIYYEGSGGSEFTVAELAESGTTSDAFTASKLSWNKTCLLADLSASNSSRCLELIEDETPLKFRAFFEKDFNSDSDFSDEGERIIYESDIVFLRFLEPEWTSPVRATNINFSEFSTNIDDFGVNPKAYIYPRNIYADMNEDAGDLVFQVNAPDTEFDANARFVYADNLAAAYNESDRSELTVNRTELNIADTAEGKTLTWIKTCDDSSDGELLDCLSPEIRSKEKAIEIVLFSTEEGVDSNSIVYVFPLSFETPGRPSITIQSPEETEAPNQDFVPVLVETGEAAVCKVSTEEADFNFDTEGIELTPNTDKTEHSTEALTGLVNNSNNTLHVKCAVESLLNIQNYEKVDFSIGKDQVNIDWVSPDFQNSDFTDTSADAGKPFLAVYNENTIINSESSGNLSIKFKPTNKEVDYATLIGTFTEEIDFNSLLDDPTSASSRSFFSNLVNLADIDGNTTSNYSRSNIDPGEETTIRWDKQCVATDGETDKLCSVDEFNVLAIQIVDQETDQISYYFFPLEVSDESVIESCEISGDELVFNPTTEGLLFTYQTTSENVTSFDYTLKVFNSSDREIAEILDENNADSGSGTFAWEGEIGSSRTVSDGNYSVVFTVEDDSSDQTCEDSWNFLVDNREPFTSGEFEILIDEDEFTAPEETLEITLNHNKDTYRTVVNVYKKGKDKPSATIYSCVAGEDTEDEDEPCPEDISFEWDGSHFFDYLPEGEYFLRGSILDSSGITTASISEDFTLNHGNIKNTASDNTCTDYFTDIASNDPLCAAVGFVRESEIFLGSNGLIEVNRPLTRAEFIVVTNRIKEQEDPSTFSRVSTYSPQRDGNMGHSDLNQFVGNVNARWFMEEIWRAKQVGLVRGYSDGTMKPLNLIAGPEAFKLVQLATEVNSSRENTNPWYLDYTEFNYRNGLDTGGITESTTAVTRGQLIYYIYQLNRAGLYTP
jgi:hypothetical protein